MGDILKLVLNGSYGALATPYFVLFNNHVAGTITAEGRELTKKMNEVNEYYWINEWHNEKELHKKLCIKNVNQISNNADTSIYCDTDSLFVSMKPALDSCVWRDLIINKDFLTKLNKKFIIIKGLNDIKFENSNCLGSFYYDDSKVEKKDFIKNVIEVINNLESSTYIIIDGYWITDWDLFPIVKDNKNVKWNWNRELDIIHGIDKFRYAKYFVECLEKHADTYGIENKQDFELERISESMINIAKKKYICHIVYEDGIPYDRFSYIYPKGVELIRSSTPLFARDKIVNIINYLFKHPDDFNIKELLKIVKDLKREFYLCVPDKIDDISMQSSCSKYNEKVLNDKDKLEFVNGAHFAVKASAYYNYLLHKNKSEQSKYEFLKSGTKIKYYYCKDNSVNDIFAYIRGSYPIEFAPEIDLDTQFEKSILSPINAIIQPLGLPLINKRLSVIMDIFGGI